MIIPTVFFLQVAERRRLLLSPDRLGEGGSVLLNTDEQHYLRRVLRLRRGARLDVTNGCGSLWSATLLESDRLQIDDGSQQIEQVSQPSLGLAFALMRRGADDVVRMACELGVDRIQPLRCERCVPQAEHRPDRWAAIVREAVEQCERLWRPQLLPLAGLPQWLSSGDGQRLVGVTREMAASPLQHWLHHQADPGLPTWLVIGPEGGWTAAELRMFSETDVHSVQMGSTILRSSTAAVAASVEMVRWRDHLNKT